MSGFPSQRDEDSVRARLQVRIEAHPDRVALRFANVTWSYAELGSQVNRAANGLCQLGVGPGSNVALMLPNGPEFVACWLALAYLGAALVPLNTRLIGDVLSYQLSHAEPDLAIVGARQLAAFEAAHPPGKPGLHVLVD